MSAWTSFPKMFLKNVFLFVICQVLWEKWRCRAVSRLHSDLISLNQQSDGQTSGWRS